MDGETATIESRQLFLTMCGSRGPGLSLASGNGRPAAARTDRTDSICKKLLSSAGNPCPADSAVERWPPESGN
jgi:hypothetical protein